MTSLNIEISELSGSRIIRIFRIEKIYNFVYDLSESSENKFFILIKDVSHRYVLISTDDLVNTRNRSCRGTCAKAHVMKWKCCQNFKLIAIKS